MEGGVAGRLSKAASSNGAGVGLLPPSLLHMLSGIEDLGCMLAAKPLPSALQTQPHISSCSFLVLHVNQLPAAVRPEHMRNGPLTAWLWGLSETAPLFSLTSPSLCLAIGLVDCWGRRNDCGTRAKIACLKFQRLCSVKGLALFILKHMAISGQEGARPNASFFHVNASLIAQK